MATEKSLDRTVPGGKYLVTRGTRQIYVNCRGEEIDPDDDEDEYVPQGDGLNEPVEPVITLDDHRQRLEASQKAADQEVQRIAREKASLEAELQKARQEADTLAKERDEAVRKAADAAKKDVPKTPESENKVKEVTASDKGEGK